MSDFDWNPYLIGGGQRADAITGLDGEFRSSLVRMMQSAPPEIRDQLRLNSGFRSDDVQSRLFADAVAKYGSEAAARKWVAPPGKSRHNHGGAVDMKFLSPEAKAWVHENLGEFGLHAPMEWEPWHIEAMGSRGGPSHAPGGGHTTNALAVPEQPPQPEQRRNALATYQQDPRDFMTRNALTRPTLTFDQFMG